MKLINIYLIGLGHYIYVIYIISTSPKPIKYIVWNNEIISWRLCWLCIAAFWLATFLENGLELGMVMECCGSYWGLYMVLLIYNLLPQQNKK